ncbi:MAG: recombinase RecA [Oscillospiraceae bacterium]|nr:recombinase RecA [Oscillospiraceae bacterium]
MADKKKKALPSLKQVSGDEKKIALEAALAHIEKEYGKGAIMRLGSRPDMNVEVIPTGSLTLDMALGVGGLPRGRIIEVYGSESSGKTTLALHCIAEAQKLGGYVAFIDVEHALDPTYAAALGVNLDDLLVSQPDSGEQALEIAEELIRSGALDMIVIDSVAAMVTKAEIEGDMGDAHVGLLARLMSQAMRKLTAAISKTNTVAIFINQIREKIGGVAYGNNETTPGGRALKFYSSVRIEIKYGTKIKSGDDVTGRIALVKVVKNKVAPPFKECQFDIMYGTGIDRMGEIIDLAVDLKIIKKSGSWFSYEKEKIAQGRDAAKKYLKEHPDVQEEIVKLIYEKREEVEKNLAEKAKAERRLASADTESTKQLDELLSDEESPEEGTVSLASEISIDPDDDYSEFTPE